MRKPKKAKRTLPRALPETPKQRERRERQYLEHLNSVSFTRELTPEEQKKFDDEDNADESEP